MGHDEYTGRGEIDTSEAIQVVGRPQDVQQIRSAIASETRRAHEARLALT